MAICAGSTIGPWRASLSRTWRSRAPPRGCASRPPRSIPRPLFWRCASTRGGRWRCRVTPTCRRISASSTSGPCRFSPAWASTSLPCTNAGNGGWRRSVELACRDRVRLARLCRGAPAGSRRRRGAGRRARPGRPLRRGRPHPRADRRPARRGRPGRHRPALPGLRRALAQRGLGRSARGSGGFPLPARLDGPPHGRHRDLRGAQARRAPRRHARPARRGGRPPAPRGERQVHHQRGHGLRGPGRGHRRAGDRDRRTGGLESAAVHRDELAFAGVARQAELVRAGEVSSRELVELYLERIERLDPQLNAFRVVMAERALTEADQADGRRGSGEERPLLGVPLAVKDNMHVAGELTCNGGRSHGGPADEDAGIIRTLREAGAVIIGKTHLPELAIIGATDSTAFGMSHNPWNTERTTGGSSGGSGAAVAAGLVAGATASRGAGSDRIPPAPLRPFGLKPQRDRVSLAPDREHWYGLSVYGFLARSVADTALLLDVAADRRPKRSLADAAATPPGPLRIAVSLKPAVQGVPVHAEVRRAVEETADVLRSLGHEVVNRDPALGDIGPTSLIPRYFGGIAQEARRVPHPERLEPRTKGFVRMGRPYLPLIERIRRDEARHVERIGRLFEDHDVLLTPTLAKPPVDVGEWAGRGALRTFLGLLRTYPFTGIWNATGQPAAAVPAGFTGDGVPLSVQLVGRTGDEATLLSLSGQIEHERPWGDHRPPVS